METKKTEKEEKADFIRKISEVFEKHCTDKYDLESVLNSITSFNDYMYEMSSYRHGITIDVHYMKRAIEKDCKDLLVRFGDMSDSFIEGMIISNQCNHGMDLLSEMKDDLQLIP